MRLGGVLGEHDLVRLGADEPGDRGACGLVGLGGLFGQLMRAPVRRGVAGLEEPRSASST